MLKLYKLILKYALLATGLSFIVGLSTNIYLAYDSRWIRDSISYLGTKPSTHVTFFLFLFITSTLNLIFQIAVVTFPTKIKQMRRIQKIGTICNIFIFIIAWIGIVTAGIIPTSVNSNVHHNAAVIFFSFYSAGMLLWGILNINSMKATAVLSVITGIIIIVGGGFAKDLVANYFILEVPIILLILTWNLLVYYSLKQYLVNY